MFQKSLRHTFSRSLSVVCLVLWVRVHLREDTRAEAVSGDTCLEAPRKVTICNINNGVHFE